MSVTLSSHPSHGGDALCPGPHLGSDASPESSLAASGQVCPWANRAKGGPPAGGLGYPLCAMLRGPQAASFPQGSWLERRLLRLCWVPGRMWPCVCSQSGAPVPSLPAVGAQAETRSRCASLRWRTSFLLQNSVWRFPSSALKMPCFPDGLAPLSALSGPLLSLLTHGG